MDSNEYSTMTEKNKKNLKKIANSTNPVRATLNMSASCLSHYLCYKYTNKYFKNKLRFRTIQV